MNSPARSFVRRSAPKPIVAAALIALLAHGEIAPHLQAGNDTWNQTAAGTYVWGVPGNWLSGAGFPNAVGDIANLNIPLLGAQTINLDQVVTLGTLNIGDVSNAFGFTLAGGTGGYLIFDALAGMAAINKIGGAADVISAGIQFNDPFWISNNGAGLLTLSGALRSVSSNITLGGAGTGGTTISGAISTAGNLVKNDTGTVTLSTGNTYAGTTTVNAGTLILTSTTALPIRSAVSIAGGAILDVQQALTMGSLSGAGDLTNSSGTNRIVTIGRDDTSTTFTGRINPATTARVAITKIGAGTLTLRPTGTNASTYTGNTILNGGAIVLDTSNSTLTSGFLGTTPLQIAGGNFGMTGRSGAITSQTLGNFTLGATGGSITLTPNGGASTTLALGTITSTAAGGALLVNAPATTTVQFNQALTAPNARIVFTGDSGASYDWAVNGGVNTPTGGLGSYTDVAGLTLSGTDTNNSRIASAVASETTTVSGGTWTTNSLKIDAGAAGQTLALANNLVLASGGLLFTGSNDYAITSSGGTLNSATATNSDLIIHHYGAGNLSIGAAIVNGVGASTLTKAGTGTLTLANANTFTGAVFVNGGTLSFSNNNQLGAATGPTAVTIRDGATLQYTGATATIAATGAASHTFALQGGNGTIGVTNAGTDLTLSGVISGAGGYTKTGPGALLIGASSTFTGPLFINEGTVKPTGSFQVSSSSSPVTIGASGTLDINGTASSQTMTVGSLAGSGTILNSGGSSKTLSVGGNNTSTTFSGTFGAGSAAGNVLTKIGSGIFTLANTTTSAWTGGNNVNNGTLLLATSNALSTTGTMSISLAAGPAQLELDSGVTQTLAALTFYGTGTTATSQGNVLIGSGATLTLGGTLTVNNTNNPLGAVIGGAGTLAMTTARTFDVRDSAAVPAGSPELLVSTAISGAGGITKAGNGTLLLTGTNTSTGTNTFQNGLTLLDYTANNTHKIGTGALAMSGGTLVLNGNAGAGTSQTVASTTLAGGGASTITLNPGGAQQIVLNLGAFTRAAGAGTLRLNLPAGAQSATNGVTTTTANAATGILGGWATVFDGTQTGFATNSGGNLVALASLPKDDVATWLAGEHVTDTIGYFNSTAADLSIGSLRFDAAGPSTVTVGAGLVLGVASGGILQTSNVTGGTSTITGGRLTSGPDAELIFTTDSASQRLDVASIITGSNAITKSGNGTLRLSGNNTSVGNVALRSGILELTGGNAIGDTSAVVLSHVAGNPTLSLLAGQTETIGNLSGGGTTGGTVLLGAGSILTVNQVTNQTFAGPLSGSGTLVKAGTGTLTLDYASTGFTGALVVNQGRFTLTNTFGAILNASSVTLNGAEFQNAQNQTGSVDRIANTATVTLNNTAGTSGFLLSTNQNATRGDTIGNITLNAGQNVVTLDATGGTSSIGRLTVGSNPGLSRSNNATALFRGRNLGLSSGRRTELLFTTTPTGAIGGGGGAGTTTISIYPFLVGQTIGDASPGAGDLGNSFVTYGANGMRPLVITTGAGAEYIFDEAGYNAMGATTTNNVRFTTTPAATLAAAGGGARTINALAIDSGAGGVAITGPGSDTLTLAAGALLSTGANANSLGGFAGIGTGTSEYVVFTPDGNQLTLGSPLTTGAAALTKAGAGTLILNGLVNTYSGGTWFNEGAIQAAALGNLGAGNLNFFGGALQFGGVFDPSLKTTNFGVGGGIFDTNGNNITVAGAIGGGGAGSFTKTGLGTLTLNAAANWTGSTTASGGTLQLGVVNAITSDVIVSGGGTLDIAGLSPTFTTLTLGTGANQVIDSLPAANAITVTGQTTLTEGTVAPVLAGTANVVKTGTTTATLSNPANTYTGLTWVQNGTLAISGLANAGFNSSLGAPTGTNAEIFLGAGTTTGTLQYTGAIPAGTDRPIVLAGSTGGGVIDSGTSGGPGLLTMTGRAYAFNTGNRILTLQGANGTIGTPNVYVGLIEDGYGVVGLTKAGTGVWDLTNTNTFTGSVTVTGGRLHVSGSVSNSPVSGGGATSIGSAAGTEGVLYLSGPSYDTNTFAIGNNATGFGVLVINGPNVAANSTAANAGTIIASTETGGYGGLFMSSGSFATQRLDLGRNGASSATAVLQMSGGTLNWTEYMLGRAGLWEMTFSGVNAVRTGAAQSLSLGQATGTGVMTVSGGVVDNSGQVVAFGRTGTGGTSNTSTLNLNGGTLTTDAFTATSTNFAAAYVNFNGGTLRANIDTAAFLPTGLTGVYVNAGGAIIDSNGRDITIASNLLAPSGSGVTAIPVATNGSGYLGAPYVEITGGGGGFGATASANVDLDPASATFGQLLGITITNPGHNYTSAPTVNLVGGLSTTGTAATLGTATTGANTSGGLTKDGLGTLTLSGATLGYTGATVVNAGTLSITGSTGSAPSTTGITVAGGATLNLVNTATQSMNSLASLSLGAGSGTASIGLELGDTSNYDSLGTTGVASLANAIHLNIVGISGFGTGAYTLLQGAATSGFDTNASYTYSLPGGYTYSDTLSDTSVVLNVGAAASNSALYWLGGVNNQWGGFDGSFNSNWTTDLAGTTNAQAAPDATTTAIFSTSTQTLAGTLATTLETPFAIHDLLFNSQTGTGPISAITIAPGATGTLTITPSASTAGINMQTGAPAAVTISAPVILGAAQTWQVADAGSTLRYTGSLSGDFNLKKDGAGTLVLTANATRSAAGGTSTLTSGILRLEALQALSTGSGIAMALDGGTLSLAAPSAGTFNGVNATVGGNAKIELDRAVAGAGLAYTVGTLGIGAQTLTVEPGANVTSGAAALTAGAVTLTGTPTFTVNNSGSALATLTLGAIGDGGSGYGFTKNGNGTLILNSASTFTGVVTLDAGTLRNSFAGTTGLGTGAATLVLNGGRLELANSTGRNSARNTAVAGNVTISTERLSAGAGVTHTLGTLSIGSQTLTVESAVANSGTQGLTFGATTLTGNPTFEVKNGATTTLLTLGAIGDGGSGYGFTKTGNGTLILGSASTFTGAILVKAGTLVGGNNAGAFGDAANVITLGDSSGTADSTLNPRDSIIYAQPITVASGNTGVASIIGGNTTGSPTLTGAITLNTHDLTIGKIGTSGVLTLSGGITGTGNLTIHNQSTTTGTIVFSGAAINPAGAITHTGTATGTTTISADIGSNVTSLTQNSATSALTLSGTNIAYTGATNVSAGTLNITGSAGTPFTSNAITVAGGGTLNLLNSTGQTFNLSGLSLGAGSGTTTLGLELGSTSAYDSLQTAAVASLANTVRFNLTELAGFGNGAYTLLQGGAGSGFHSNAAYEFGAMPGGYAYSTTLSDTSVVLNVSSAASTLYWLGGLGDGKWNTFTGAFDTNWASDLAGTTNAKAIPGSASTVVFNTSNQTVAGTLATTLETSFSINDLIFNGQVGTGPISAITIGTGAGGSLTLNSAATGIDVQTGAPAVSIAPAIVLGASQSWNVADSGATLTMSGAITDGGGGFGLTKTGPGRLLLGSASSTYTGGTTLNAGTIAITGSGSDGANTAIGLGTLTINGGTLELASTTGSKTLYVPVTVAGNFALDNTSTGPSDTWTWNKAITLSGGTHTITVQPGIGTATIFSGAIGDGGNNLGFTKAGTGILALTGANTFTGNLTIDAGTLRASGGTNRLGAGNLILNGGTLDINDNTGRNFARPTTVTANSEIITERASAGAGVTHTLGTLSIGGHTLTVSGGNVTSGTARLDFGATTFSGAPTFTINNPTGGGVTELRLGALDNQGNNATVTGNGNLAQSGIWDGAGDFILDSTYTGTVALTLGNTFTGDIIAKSGTLSGASTSVTNVFGGGTIQLGDSSTNANNVLLTTAISSANIANPIVLGSGTTGSITLRAINSGSGTTYTGGVTGTNNLRLETTNVGALTLSTSDFDIVGAVTNAGTGTGAVTISSNITSNVTNIVQGSATSALNLSGSTIAFTGATTVSAGTLNVTSAAGLPTGTTLTVDAGGTLNLVNGAGQNLGSLAGLSLGSGAGIATLGFELGSSSDQLTTASAATALNTIRFNLTGITGFGAGNYNLLSAASGLTSSTPAYQVGSAPGGYTYTFNNTDALIQLVVAAGATGNIYWRGDVDSSWSTYNGGNTNWVDGSGTEFGSSPGSGNVVIFSNSGAPTPISTTLDANFVIDSIQFTGTPSGSVVSIAPGSLPTNSLTLAPATATDGIDVAANAGTITISAPVVIGANQEWDVNATGASLLVSGEVSGSANVTLTNTGEVTLSADNPSYSGTTTVSAGTLRVGAAGATGSLGTGNVVNNSALVFNRTGTFTVPNLISGTGTLTKSANGIMTLNNDSNSFAGPVTITAGTLNFTSIGNVAGGPNNSAMGAPGTVGEGTISLAGTLGFTGSSNQNTDRLLTLTGTGTLAANGTGGATITYNGAITAFSGSTGYGLILTGDSANSAGIIAAPITQAGTSADVSVTSGDWTIASSTAHTFSDDIFAANPGTILRLGGAADSFAFTSGTSNFFYSRNGATVQLLASGVSSPTAGLEGILVGFDTPGAVATFDTNGFNLNATRLDLGGYQTGLEGSVIGSGTITGTTWNIYRGTVHANLAGSGTFTKSGLGTVTLYGDNSGLTGATTINHGELVLDYTLDNTNRKINNGGLLTMAGSQLTVTGNASANTAVTVNGLTLSSGSNVLDPNSGGGALTTTLNLGTLTRAASAGTLRLDLTDPGAIVTTTTANGTHGLLGLAGFATVKDSTGTWFARNDGSNNILSLASTVKNDVSTWAPGDHITDSGSGFTGTISCTNINSLRFDAFSGSAVNLNPGAVLSIASGGILVTDQVTSGSPGIFGGTLATGVTELILTQDSSQLFEISSRINVNNAFTKTGNGTLLLSGFNTYSGATQIHAGALQVTGNSIGDTSAVTLATARDTTLQLLADETIGQLAGGQRNTSTDLGTVNLGAHTLTINQGAATTYAGTFSGSGTVIKRGASTLTMQGNDPSGLFTGTFRVDQGVVTFSGTGNQLAGVTNVILNGAGSSLDLNNNETTAVGSRIADGAFITLNSTAGTAASALGLYVRRTGGSSTGTETVGRLILNSGHNTVAADGTGTDRIGQLNFTNATPLVRNNFSTLFVVGRNLGVSSGQRGSIRFASNPGGAIGGGGAANTSTISIFPYMVGEVTTGVPSGAVNFGNSFVRYVNATDGLKPLDLTTEYVVNETAYNALGAGVLTNNIRFTATPGGVLDSDTTGINSLVLDGAVTVTGPAQSLQITSGAILAASAGANAIGGFTGLTSANPYYVYVTNPTGTLTLNSALTSSQTLVKSGAGTLILATDNSVTDVYLNQGILEMDDLDRIGGNTGAFVFAGGTLRLGAGFTDDLSTRTLSFLIGGGTLDTAGIDLALANSLGSGEGGFTKTGAGNLTLNAAATYTGPTTLTNGTLTIGANNALGVGGDLTLGAGTTLALGANSLSHALVTTSGASPLITGTGTITASTGFFFNHTGNTQIDALLAGPGGLLKAQTNVLTLTGASTYTGPTEVRAGTLSFDSIGNVGGGASALGNPGTLEDGIIRMGLTTTATTLTYTGSGHSTDRIIEMQGTTGGLTINSNGTGALGLGTIKGATAGAKTLTLDGAYNTTDNTVALINECVATLTLAKTGASTWLLNGDNVYSGATNVDNGILKIGLDDSLPSTTAVRIGTGATAGTLDLNGFDQTIGSLTSQTNSGSVTNTLIVDTGNTLTVNGAVTIGANANNSITNFSATGGGSFVNNNSGGTFQIGGATTTDNENTATVDFSGLGTFTADLGATGTFRIGDNSATTTATGPSTLTLATDSTITANLLQVASQGTNATQTLRLGAGVNTLNVNTLTVGGVARSSGVLDFAGATGSLVLRAADGSSRAAVNLGSSTFSTGNSHTTTVDLTGHDSDLLVSTLTMASRTQNSGATTATLSFDQGTLDVTTLTMASRTGTGTGGATATVNLGDSAAPGIPTVNIGALNMAVNTSAGGTVTADLNVTGGTVTIGTGSGTAIHMANAGAGRTVTSTIDLTGGTVDVTGNIIRTGGAGTENATVTLNGSLLDMNGFSIGSAAQNITLAAESGTLENLGQLNGGGALTKTTGGVLTMQGTNTYTGATNISDGILLVNGDNSGATGSVSVSSGATLGGSGTLGGATTIDGTLSTGADANVGTVGSLAFNGQNLTFNDNSTWLVDIVQGGTPSSDAVTGVNNLTINGTVELVLAFSGTYQLGNQYTLASYTGSRSGTFQAMSGSSLVTLADDTEYDLDGGGRYLVNYNDTSGFTLTAVPEPAALLPLAMLLIAGLLPRRRRRMRGEAR